MCSSDLILQIPYSLMFPAIILFTAIGVYSTENSTFDLYSLIVFGALGCLMMVLKLEAVPLIMGYILGHAFEEHFRRALLLSRGDFSVFVTKPISAVALGLCIILFAWSLHRYLRARTLTPARSAQVS